VNKFKLVDWSFDHLLALVIITYGCRNYTYYHKDLISLKIDNMISNAISGADVYDAIKIIEKVWQSNVSFHTIMHCWRHASFYEVVELNDSIDTNFTGEMREIENLLQQLSDLSLESGGTIPTMTAKEYVDFETELDLNVTPDGLEDNIRDSVLPICEEHEGEASNEESSMEAQLPIVRYS
jgi:hypothetical protein